MKISNILVYLFFFTGIFTGCVESKSSETGAIEIAAAATDPLIANPVRKTIVFIVGEKFHINGKPTLEGRTWKGISMEGLLPNSRMVQGIFDDLNPATRERWVYPDTKIWDPERNTEEFVENMIQWNQNGLLSFTINLQGGSPEGYSKSQPWINSAIAPDGSLREAYMKRLERILDKADDLGMAPILGFFYFGQDERIKGEEEILKAVDNTMDWLFEKGYTHVLIEINNECDINYDHAILQPERVHELINRVKLKEKDGRRFLVSTSYSGGKIPLSNVVKAADYILLHGNGVNDPKRIRDMVAQSKQVEGFKAMPIIFNEDDHFDFDKADNNIIAATESGASWGYFDFRMANEGYEQGYQSVPVDWGINSERKKGFFDLLRKMTH
jgi:hypothetical protein